MKKKKKVPKGSSKKNKSKTKPHKDVGKIAQKFIGIAARDVLETEIEEKLQRLEELDKSQSVQR